MDSDLEQVAHILRRCGFGPAPNGVDRWAEAGPASLIDSLLDTDQFYSLSEAEALDLDPDDELDEDTFRAFFDQMIDQTNPLHERMTWYWHTHFTTGSDSSDGRFVWQQHHLIRRLALGNFVDLARAITTDAAMLFYLDGAGSYAENPNENYARELLELFTLGRDAGYTEDDVRGAARILAGWDVDWETGEVMFYEDDAYDRPVTFMGERRRWDLDSFIAFLCSRPQCHRHVSRRLYRHLVGPEPTPARLDELAAVFAASGLEIKPLVAEILRGDDFAAAIHSRARQPIEWVLGAVQAIGFESMADAGVEPWHLEVLGQIPYQPPNVAGWPLDDRWASASQLIARTSVLLEWELPERTLDEVEPVAEAVLERCGIFEPSRSTRDALAEIERSHSEFDRRLELLFATALTSPEFTLL